MEGVDGKTETLQAVNNKELHHVHGACNPIMALDGKSVDAMVVGGIGAGAKVTNSLLIGFTDQLTGIVDVRIMC